MLNLASDYVTGRFVIVDGSQTLPEAWTRAPLQLIGKIAGPTSQTAPVPQRVTTNAPARGGGDRPIKNRRSAASSSPAEALPLGDAQQDAHIAAIRRGDPAVADLSVLNCRGHTACMATKKRGPKSPMTAAHKAALAAGRNGSRIVKNYLDALDSNRPKRGRKRTPASIQQRLGEIDARLADADPLSRLNLYQERMNLHTELEAMEAKVDLTALEDDFVSVAYEYSSRRGISYAAWREAGVGASVLKRAGITRSM
jgi:hypothetical protein